MNPTIGTVYLVVAGLVFLLGFVILREAPGERANRATALMLFFAGMGSMLGAIGFILERPGGPQPGGNDLLRSFNYLWEMFFPSLLYFACVFPSQNRLHRRVPFATLLIFAPHVFHLLFLFLIGQGALWGGVIAGLSKSPLGRALVSGFRLPFELTIQFHQILFSLVNLFYIVAALTLLFISYRRAAESRLKSQLLAIFIGLASCAGFYAAAVPLPILFNNPISLVTRSMLIVGALILGSGAIAYSMVRYRFLDANLIARKSILYAVTSAFLLGVYVTIVRQIDAFLETVSGMDTSIFQTAMLLVALVLFQPIFSWLDEALDRWFLRDRSDHRAVLRRLSSEVLTVLDMEKLTEKVISTLREAVPARTTVLLIAPEGKPPVVRGFGGGVAIERIAEIPRLALARYLEGAEILRDGEVAAEARDRRVEAEIEPLLETLPFVVLPLRHAGEFLGVIALGRKITETRYKAEELNLLQTLANQVSVAAKNALLYKESLEKTILEEELSVARRIQRQFLPETLPQTRRFGLAALNVQSKQVGGDYYDLVPLGNGCYLVVIVDVAGKGVPAALLASMVQASIRTQADESKPAQAIMSRLNRLVHEATPEDRFATCFLARIDAEGLVISFSNAGHNFPILLPATGGWRYLEEGGIPLGIVPDFVYPQAETTLLPGDALLLYTDGITDARNLEGEDFGEDRLVRLAERLPRAMTADELVHAVAGEVSRFTAGAEQADDITLVALKAL
ncbi:MAG TPA: GAF domain-containing SpoIIE family protein phosphatase [Acidobacteriota bacterium]|nr:GAF domain-containing SpoIIE family protein phosphatase [Acidobacteriota bacterium]